MEELEMVREGAMEEWDEGEDESTGQRGLWKTLLFVVAVVLILVIALGLLRFWMVSSYGGW